MACEFDAMGALSTNTTTPRKKPPVLMTLTVTVCYRWRRRYGGGRRTGTRVGTGAHIYAEIVGYGATSDGADMLLRLAKAQCVA